MAILGRKTLTDVSRQGCRGRSAGRFAVAASLALAGQPIPADEGAAQPMVLEHFFTLAESLWREDFEPDGFRRICVGAYHEPLPRLELDVDSSSEPIVVSSESGTSLADEYTELEGGVEVRQGNRRLTAESLVLDESESVARTVGVTQLSEPGVHVLGSDATIDMVGDRASMDDADFVLVDLGMRGSAARVEREGGRLDLRNATVTRCPPRNDTWRVRARSVRVDEGFVTARGARLLVGSVPVFYAPYLRYPASGDRSSGFLLPSVSQDSDDGLDLTLPYYLNLAPNYDATFAPRWIERRGVGVEGEFRHLSHGFRTAFTGAFLADDRRYDGELARLDADAERGGFSPADRWSVHADHRGGIGRLRTRVDFAAVSDNDYFADLGSDLGAFRRVSLERRAELQYVHGGLFARLLGQGFQRLEPGREPYRRLPEANVAYAGTLAGPLSWSVGTSWVSFSGGRLAGETVVTGDRRHLESRLRLAFGRSWGFLNVVGGIRHTGYDLSHTPPGANPDPDRNIRLGILDAGLFLERPVFDGDGGGGWVQTLEPRVYYLRQSHEEQDHLPAFDAAPLTFSYGQLFRDNRFAGIDRIGDANRISLGVETRLLSPVGAEALAARIGAVTYLDPRRIDLAGAAARGQPHADMVAELRGSLGRWRVLSKLAWRTDDGELDEAGLALGYRKDPMRIVNLGYRRRLPDVDQTDISLHWPLPWGGRRWSAFGRWNHDWEEEKIVEGFAGLAYANCCVEIKFLWHRRIDLPRNLPNADVRIDRGVALQIEFRGFAGFGSRVDSRLVRGIKGFQPADR